MAAGHSVLLCFSFVSFFAFQIAAKNQQEALDALFKAKFFTNSIAADSSEFLVRNEAVDQNTDDLPTVEIHDHTGLKQQDKIERLPGQPPRVSLSQYGGYVTVNKTAGRAFYYYFVESPQNKTSLPLLLWLNGGNGDKNTANDNYAFLVNWLERFLEYKDRDFYISGESYAGHFVPQLAQVILLRSSTSRVLFDQRTNQYGMYDFFVSHELIADRTANDIKKYCLAKRDGRRVCRSVGRGADVGDGERGRDYRRSSMAAGHSILLCFFLFFFAIQIAAKNQKEALDALYKAKFFRNSNAADSSGFFVRNEVADQITDVLPTVEIHDQTGRKQQDKIERLPGQPPRVSLSQYGGYVTVNKTAGRAFYYYFVESPRNKTSLPLLLWLNGGPGCSSLAYGAMAELGPFRARSDGKTLFQNDLSWARGHYVPQLAHVILSHNKNAGKTIVNLKGIIIGNAVINDETDEIGMYDFFATHALIADRTAKDIKKYCNFSPNTTTQNLKCIKTMKIVEGNTNMIDIYNIYYPICGNKSLTDQPKKATAMNYDPCTDYYTHAYLNRAEVQRAMHANVTKLAYRWTPCSNVINNWSDSTSTVIPLLREFMDSGLRVWIFSGDVDGRVPITSSKYSIASMKLPVKKSWYPWFVQHEVGGYAEEYEGGLTLATVRGAGHEVPSFQPIRALVLITHFLKGTPLSTFSSS
ncbi:Serine carboxypeptidase-like 40, partial [Cucurbita argyrosperma subsp. argyrosperma]